MDYIISNLIIMCAKNCVMAAKCAHYLKYTQTSILNAELLRFTPEPVVPRELLNVFGAG